VNLPAEYLCTCLDRIQRHSGPAGALTSDCMQVVIHLNIADKTAYVLDSLAGPGEEYPDYKGTGETPTELEMYVESFLRFLEESYTLHYPGRQLPEALKVRPQPSQAPTAGATARSVSCEHKTCVQQVEAYTGPRLTDTL
jgi:hypothetical protein